MAESMLLIQVLQFLLSSFLVFGVTALLIEGGLLIFKIDNSRIRAILRYVPILKLPLDLILYIFSACLYLTNLNPLSCQSYLEHLIVRTLRLDTNETTYPLSQWVSEQIPKEILDFALSIVGALFLIMLIQKIVLTIRSYRHVQKMILSSLPSSKEVTHKQLQLALKQRNVLVRISNAVPVPTAVLSNVILFPEKQLATLSQEEFESIVAHELEHLNWSDPTLKFASAIVGSFFWWLPTKRWLNKLEQEQELASDAAINKYDLDSSNLASAILKISKQAQEKRRITGALCYLSHSTSFTLKRVENLLKTDLDRKKKRYLKQIIFMTSIGLLLLVVFRIC